MAVGLGLLALPACSLIQWDILESDWKFDAITTMKTPADPPLSCGVSLPRDELAAERETCTFQAGATPEASLGVAPDTASAIPIRHVIVVMKENRSFDHLLGNLDARGQPDASTMPPGFTNRDLHGNVVVKERARSTCLEEDPDHQWAAMHEGVAGGAMTGFVESAASSTSTRGHFVMHYYDEDDLPFYYWLARTYALDDRHFASMASGTYANRNFLLFGTNAGIVDSGLSFPDPSTNSILRELIDAGFTWAVYTDGLPFSGALDWDASEPGVHPFDEFLTALDDGTLPNVAFVDAIEDVEDDHPPADIQVGEAWLRRIYEHAVKSPEWDRLALLWTYDEGGGFADHVPPPDGCVARASDGQFHERGPRIPFVVISPWAKRGYVSHVVEDHTAITRFIELLFDLPALTARDANSPALLDMFDFACDRDRAVSAAPASGSDGCHS